MCYCLTTGKDRGLDSEETHILMFSLNVLYVALKVPNV